MRNAGRALRLTLVLIFPAMDAISAADDFSGKVVGVSDGDTITVLRDRTPIKVRLNGIDCPEMGQDFGSRAKSVASELAFGKVVTVHPSWKDRYGRTVADVILPAGRVLNHELVRRGVAWWCRKYAPNPNAEGTGRLRVGHIARRGVSDRRARCGFRSSLRWLHPRGHSRLRISGIRSSAEPSGLSSTRER